MTSCLSIMTIWCNDILLDLSDHWSLTNKVMKLWQIDVFFLFISFSHFLPREFKLWEGGVQMVEFLCHFVWPTDSFKINKGYRVHSGCKENHYKPHKSLPWWKLACCCLLSSSIWTVCPSAQCYSIIGAGSNQLFKRWVEAIRCMR